MNIYCIGLEETELSSKHLLDWITSPQVGRGKNCERYWIIKTNTFFNNRNNDPQAHLLLRVLRSGYERGFDSIMITKQDDNRREGNESPQGDTPPIQEQPSNPDNPGSIPEEAPRT